MPATRNYRKRRNPNRGAEENDQNVPSDSEEQSRLALEEVKFLQKQRERKLGIPAFSTVQAAVSGLPPKAGEKVEGGDGEKDDLVLQDTFAQETAVTIEDPNMLKYIEQELAKKRGKIVNSANQVENDLKSAEDELYAIPEHLKVKKRNSEESSTQWTTGIAEVQLPIEYKLKNIEETEAAKKLLQEKRLAGRTKTELSIPSSYSADFFQRGRDYAERLRREHPELYKERAIQDNSGGPKSSDTTSAETAGRRQAATDEFMLERFRKRERNRVMHRQLLGSLIRTNGVNICLQWMTIVGSSKGVFWWSMYLVKYWKLNLHEGKCWHLLIALSSKAIGTIPFYPLQSLKSICSLESPVQVSIHYVKRKAWRPYNLS